MKGRFKKIILSGSIVAMALFGAGCGTGEKCDDCETDKETERVTKEYEGYLIDEHCYSKKEPEEETVMCLQMDACKDSGYGIAITENGETCFFRFDTAGHEIATDFIEENSDKETLGSVIVKGSIQDGALSVESIALDE